jgi:uncharacterized membrane protein
MSGTRRGGALARLFVIGVVIKAIDGVLEMAGGVLIFFITPEHTERIVRSLTENELPGMAHNLIRQHVVPAVQHATTGSKTFAAIYLLGHGVIKLGLVSGLLLKKRVAYPVAIVAFALFLIYQLIRYTEDASALLLVLSALDAFVIVMTVLEYRRLEAEHAFR